MQTSRVDIEDCHYVIIFTEAHDKWEVPRGTSRFKEQKPQRLQNNFLLWKNHNHNILIQRCLSKLIDGRDPQTWIMKSGRN